MVEESGETQSEDALAKLTERIPQLKELRSRIDSKLLEMHQAIEKDDKRIDKSISSWIEFEKRNAPQGTPSQIDIIWTQIGAVQKYVLGLEKHLNGYLLANDEGYLELMYIFTSGFYAIAEQLDGLVGKVVTKEDADTLLSNFGAKLLRSIINRQNQLRRRWINDHFGGNAPK